MQRFLQIPVIGSFFIRSKRSINASSEPTQSTTRTHEDTSSSTAALPRPVSYASSWIELMESTGHYVLVVDQSSRITEMYSEQLHDFFDLERLTELRFSELMFGDDAKFGEQILREVFSEPDLKRVDHFLRLLPETVMRKNQLFALKYRIITLTDSYALAVLMENITASRARDAQVSRESDRLRMILSVIKHRQDVQQLISSYKRFCLTEICLWLESDKDPKPIAEHFLRQIHTFKGSFSQFRFVQMPVHLHQLEDKLTDLLQRPVTLALIEEVMNSFELVHYLDIDTHAIELELGANAFAAKEAVVIDAVSFEKLRQSVGSLVAPDQKGLVSRCFDEARFKPFRSLFEGFPKYVEELSLSMDKFVYPLEIKGGERLVEPDRYRALVQTFNHLLHNMIDHGIESLDERIEYDKPELGKIQFVIREDGAFFELRISDDGRGIDRRSVIETAIRGGWYVPDVAEALPDEKLFQLLFMDSFSTKTQVSTCSGRGVGLAAVKCETERLYGSIRIESIARKGTTFIIRIPIE